MNDSRGIDEKRVNRWPFWTADFLLILVAVVIYAHGGHWPFGDRVGLAPWTGWVLTVCVFLGASFSVLPVLLEHRLGARLAEIGRVQTAMQQVRNIEQAARQIHSATASWQAVQDDASKAVAAAGELQERMMSEVRAFQEFLQRANDSERNHLRLEVEKLRRAEGEWLQVLVRVLDQVWALYQAAVRSGKINLVEQLSHFQRACRDAAQRVGLVPFVARSGDALDPQLHQLANAEDDHRTEGAIAETLATGYRYQGQIVRKAAVVLQPAPDTETPAAPILSDAPGAQPSETTPSESTYPEQTGPDAEIPPGSEPEPSWAPKPEETRAPVEPTAENPEAVAEVPPDATPEESPAPVGFPWTSEPSPGEEPAEERDRPRADSEAFAPSEPEPARSGGTAENPVTDAQREEPVPGTRRPVELDLWQTAPEASEERETETRRDPDESRSG